MSSAAKISGAYLAGYPDSAGFLNRRRNFTRSLGADASGENAFIAADYNPNRAHTAFRGIEHLNPSPFGTQPMKDFRGIMKHKFDGLSNPNTYVNHSPIDNYYQIEPGELNFIDENPRQAEEPDFGNVEDWIHLNQRPELGDLLAEDSELRDSYFNDNLSTDSDMSGQTAGLARQQLDSYDYLDDQYLANNPDEAKLIALNIGEAADNINQNTELRKSLREEPRTSYSGKIRGQLASKVAAQLDEETQLDAKFFQDNPEAAVFLDKNPGLIERFNQRPQDAKDFKQHYGEYRNKMIERAREDAKSALGGQGIFVEDYLSGDTGFALDTAVDERLKSANSLADNTINNDGLPDKYAFTEDVYREHLASNAAEALSEGHAFDRSFFLEHPELAYAVQSNADFAEGIKAAGSEVNRFFNITGNNAQHRRNAYGAMSAFSVGYPFRDESRIDLWS